MARTVLADHARARAAAEEALAPLHEELVRRELTSIPVARLADATDGRLRATALERAGLTTVAHVLDATEYTLRQIPGVGRTTATQSLAAARQIADAARETVAVRLDVNRQQDPATTALVVALHRLVTAGPDAVRARTTAERLQNELAGLLAAARPARGRLHLLLSRQHRREQARQAVQELGTQLADADADALPLLFSQACVDLLRPPVSGIEAWVDFELRPAEYYTLLSDLTGPSPDQAGAEGFLPTDLAEKVRTQRLEHTHLRVSLRGYQAFGARFALAQRRVILGDEMGLGKTVQAIAALAHLKADGHTHFLVVCPASVLINWLRETEARSTLQAYRLHGPDRGLAREEWLRHGDIAVTTYDTLPTLDIPPDTPIGMLIADEAHYVKNPQTRRAQALATWTRRAERVLLLTGTPMENRVEEFRNLVAQVQPDLAAEVRRSLAVAGPHAFRKAVAPAYLRRNQEDVLTELPDLVRVDDWEEFSPADLTAYRTAVAAGNFMAMRRAAYADPAHSAKLQRLREVVREAADNGLKVVVFSYFRDVLATVHAALATSAPGPITGDLPAAARQRLVDDFTAAPGHAVLLSQIQAGGVGLNLQAASVVILCEPQVKPTLEDQAVARAHRMGQIRRVQVHRLLATDSVDQRMLDILAAKARAFDDYARHSDTAHSTPDAVDISEQSLARRIVEAEQQRLALHPVEEQAT
nr:DEAD/DEAH box helicase [Peterkaempfera griseoplana]